MKKKKKSKNEKENRMWTDAFSLVIHLHIIELNY